MKWLLKISYSWGDEEPYQEFNSFKEAWDTAKKDACNEAEIASIEANNETCEIGLTFEKEEDRGRIVIMMCCLKKLQIRIVSDSQKKQIQSKYLWMAVISQ